MGQDVTIGRSPKLYLGKPCRNGHDGTRYKHTNECLECKRVHQRNWKKSENGRRADRVWARKNYRWGHHITRTYGLAPDEYEEMASHGCQICGALRNPGGKTRRLFVDHDHATGKVRGILCDPCNRGIGSFRDDPAKIEKALAYLRRTAHGAD